MELTDEPSMSVIRNRAGRTASNNQGYLCSAPFLFIPLKGPAWVFLCQAPRDTARDLAAWGMLLEDRKLQENLGQGLRMG